MQSLFIPITDRTGNLHIPPDQRWRLRSDLANYIEHRTRDDANVKVYEQRRTVGYADYKNSIEFLSKDPITISSE